MATKITEEKIIEINKLYKQLGTYAAVARETGVSPTTVKKYIIPDFDDTPAEDISAPVELPPIDEVIPMTTPEEVYKCTLPTDEEKAEMVRLWKEIMM